MLKNYPRGLITLASVEMWERFSFYIMQSLLVLYAATSLTHGGLGWSEAAALRITGLYGAFVYVTPVVGGFVADRYLGRRQAINLGAILMCAGHLCLALFSLSAFYSGLGLLAIGCGLLKPSISALVGELYQPQDNRRDAGFAIFYMAINIGGSIGPLVGGYISERYSYHAAFVAAAMGLVIALVNFALGNRGDLADLGKKSLVALKGTLPPLQPQDWQRIKVYLGLCIANILWNIVYTLPYGLLTLYADKNIERTIGHFTIPAAWFFGLYGIFIVLLSPLLASFYHHLQAKQCNFTLSYKLATGYFLVSLGCLVLLPLVQQIQSNSYYIGHCGYLLGFYVLFACSELLTVPVLLAAATKMAPTQYSSTLVAANMLISWALGAYLGGEFSALTTQYNATHLFIGIIIATLILGLLHLLANRTVEACCLPNTSLETSLLGEDDFKELLNTSGDKKIVISSC